MSEDYPDADDLLDDLGSLDSRIGENAGNIARIIKRVNELEAELERVKGVTNADPDRTAYEQLTKEQKVYRLRSKLVEIAENTDGTARMEYDDVRKMFGGNPSPGHAYDLMRAAGEIDGFDYEENTPDGMKKRIVAKSDAVNDVAAFRGANKGTREEAI